MLRPRPSGTIIRSRVNYQNIGLAVYTPRSTRRYSSNKRNVHVATATAPIHHAEQYPQPSQDLKHKNYPLSKLPNWMLLRSLFIATISSHRFLLLPALSFLRFLTQPQRSILFHVDKNPILHGILKKSFYDQFCAGETGAETRACVQRLKDLGFRGVILTYARETVFDEKSQTNQTHFESKVTKTGDGSIVRNADIEDWRRGTMETASLIGAGDFLAIKLTGAGHSVTTAFAARQQPPAQMLDALREICTDCKNRSVRVIVDAESQHFQHGIDAVTLELMREFNRPDNKNNNNNNKNKTPPVSQNANQAVVFNTYQAYLKSTPSTVAKHLLAAHESNFTMGLKLVRGAYILSEKRSLIHDTKQDTDDAYNGIIEGALRREFDEFGGGDGRGKYPFPPTNLLLASHNRESVFAAYKMHRERVEAGLPTVPIAFGQLHGMSDEVSFGILAEGGKSADLSTASSSSSATTMKTAENGGVLVEKPVSSGPDVFKCTTWGSMSECIAYLLRRAVENRDAVLRTHDEYSALKSEVWRRVVASVVPSRRV